VSAANQLFNDGLDDIFGPAPQPSSYTAEIPPKPITLPVNEAGIPADLKARKQWITWSYVWSQKKGKWDKLPTVVRAGNSKNPKDPIDPANQVSYEEALAYHKKHHTDGIGFELGNGVAGLDFDACLQNHQPDAYTASILAALGSPYCEISPSGNGLKIYFTGVLPPNHKNVFKDGGPHTGIEIYSEGHYFAVTGQLFSGPSALIEVGPERAALAYFLAERVNSKEHGYFKNLWTGTNLPKSRSEAELPLCRYLYEHGFNTLEKMLAVFQYSGLAFNDWERKVTNYTFPKVAKSGTPPAQEPPPREPIGDYRKTNAAPDPRLLPLPEENPTSRLFQIAQKPIELSDKPIEWLIENMYPQHGLSIVCGREGLGKQIHALLSINAMLKDGLFLGHKANPVPHILYVDMENPESVVRERLARLGLLNADNLLIWGQWNELPPPTHFDDPLYMEYAKKTGGFIFFDSLIDFCNGAEENNPAEMNEALTKARLLARHCAGVHIQHHSDKYGKSGWRGTTAITAAVDMAFGLRAEDDDAFRRGTNREICFSTLKPKMCAPYHINYEVVGWDGHLAYRLVADREPAPTPQPNEPKQSKFKAALDIGRQLVLARLSRQEPVTVGDVKTRLAQEGTSRDTVRDVVQTLRDQFETREGEKSDRTVWFTEEKKPVELDLESKRF
jgi:AAA domain